MGPVREISGDLRAKMMDLQRCNVSDGVKVGILVEQLDVFLNAQGGD